VIPVTLVPGDPQQPCLHPIRVPDLGQAQPREQQRFLQNILRLRPVSHPIADQRRNGPEVAPDQDREGLPVSSGAPGHQAAITGLLHSDHPLTYKETLWGLVVHRKKRGKATWDFWSNTGPGGEPTSGAVGAHREAGSPPGRQ